MPDSFAVPSTRTAFRERPQVLLELGLEALETQMVVLQDQMLGLVLGKNLKS